MSQINYTLLPPKTKSAGEPIVFKCQEIGCEAKLHSDGLFVHARNEHRGDSVTVDRRIRSEFHDF